MIILIAPSYDNLTAAMSQWLGKIGAPEEKVIFLGGEDASVDALRQLLRKSPDEDLTLIFYGHGADEGLLTAPSLSHRKFDENHCWLCTAEDLLSRNRVSILAYCCSAAMTFGRFIKAASMDNGFIGYLSPLPFEITSNERQRAFAEPLEGAVKLLLANDQGMSANILTEIRRGYRDVYRKWSEGGEFSGDELSTWVCMCLEEHGEALDNEWRD